MTPVSCARPAELAVACRSRWRHAGRQVGYAWSHKESASIAHGASAAKASLIVESMEGQTYTRASNSFLRLTNRLTSAQVTNSRCAFFFSPR